MYSLCTGIPIQDESVSDDFKVFIYDDPKFEYSLKWLF